MTLVDTSVWVDHFRAANPQLQQMLVEGRVLTHPFVIGELACGNLHVRNEILGLLKELPSAEVAGHEEVLQLIDTRRLWGQGLGWIDAHLLASALLTGCELWTRDRSLHAAARRLL